MKTYANNNNNRQNSAATDNRPYRDGWAKGNKPTKQSSFVADESHNGTRLVVSVKTVVHNDDGSKMEVRELRYLPISATPTETLAFFSPIIEQMAGENPVYVHVWGPRMSAVSLDESAFRGMVFRFPGMLDKAVLAELCALVGDAKLYRTARAVEFANVQRQTARAALPVAAPVATVEPEPAPVALPTPVASGFAEAILIAGLLNEKQIKGYYLTPEGQIKFYKSPSKAALDFMAAANMRVREDLTVSL